MLCKLDFKKTILKNPSTQASLQTHYIRIFQAGAQTSEFFKFPWDILMDGYDNHWGRGKTLIWIAFPQLTISTFEHII